MRPLRLQLKGFTAFRDQVELDFTELDLFAISGPTGSGKSSLLDAMTYALYGRVERVGDQVGQLISHGQPRMAVTLEFEVGRERFRVTRTTSARRVTKIQLERLVDGEWRQAGEGSDRVREAESMIARTIGLTYDGFTRSVLLPQGKFAEFLVGDPRKRRDILTELLGLELFQRMAKRAGERSRGADARAQTKEGVLESSYPGVDPHAVKEARSLAKAAKESAQAAARAEGSLRDLSKRWGDAARRIEALESLAADAETIAGSAEEAAQTLQGLADGLRAAEAAAAAAEQGAVGAAASASEAAEALSAVRSHVGSADQLGGMKAAMEELERFDARTRTAAEALQTAQSAAKAAKERVERRAIALEETAAAAELAGRATKEWQAKWELAHQHDLVGAVVKGKKPGDPCPVCGRTLSEVPQAAAKELKAAEYELARARDADRQASDAWSRAEREHSVAEGEARHAVGDQERCRKELAALERERGERTAAVLAFFRGQLPADPASEIDARLRELREHEQRAERTSAAASAAAKDAMEARRRHGEAATEGVRLVAALRSLPIPSLLQAARALLPQLEPSAAFTATVPDDPAEAAPVAGGWASGAADVAGAVRSACSEERAALSLLLEEAQRLVPDGVDVEAASGMEDLLAGVRDRVQALAVEATALHKDADALVARLKARRDLEAEIKEDHREAALFHDLALELRADRLIAFLQAEALQVLASAGSERLASLSDGRYRLGCRDDEFFVLDTWNGDEERSVRTLSGGETFLASLSLALALADQVRSLSTTDRARLDSLFLDEGFGTLDQEALDVVRDAIGQLAIDGRLIGVITHVRDLAEQFPRIEVEKSPRGSRLKLVAT